MATRLENLKIYKMAAELELQVYKITAEFPKDERFRSINQLKRSSASVVNNISESYHYYYYQEKIHFIIIAKSEAEVSDVLVNKYTELLKAMSGYICFLREQQTKQLKTDN